MNKEKSTEEKDFEQWKKENNCWYPACRVCPSELLDCTPDLCKVAREFIQRVEKSLKSNSK